MALTIQQIREKLKSQQEKRGSFTADNAIYPFWNIAEGEMAVIRFLPDGDPTNDFFWRERVIIEMPFQGIKGQHNNLVTVTIPCMDMWDETCPILSEIKPWWKDESQSSDLPYGTQTLKELAKKYWKKRSYLFQGFIVVNPLNEETTPENPIRRLIINSSIFEKIRSSIMDPEMEDLPTDYLNGTDFKLKLTKKGGYSNYDSSEWSRKSRSLTESELQALEQHKLFDLKEFLPKKPTTEQLDVIKEMFKASVAGEEFDMNLFGEHYKPKGSYANYTSNRETSHTGESPLNHFAETKPAATVPAGAADALAQLREKLETNKEEAAPASAPAGKKLDASELLELIRNRKRTSE